MGKRTIILMLALVFCMWGLSAWADDDAMIDIDNHVATFLGTWGTNNTPILFYGDDFKWAACSGGSSITNKATFSSQQVGSIIDVTGQYAVYVRWVVHANRTTGAKYRIYDGTTYRNMCTKNQQTRGGEWVYCTTVNFTSGNYGVVELGNDCESGKYVVADAVRFVRVSKDKDDLIDEPGVDYIGGDQVTDLTSSPLTIRSVTLTAPAPGYVIVLTSGYFAFEGVLGAMHFARCSITTGTEVDLANQFAGSGMPNYSFTVPFAGVRGYQVSAGSHTFRLVCQEENGQVKVYKPQLAAQFFPTAY